MDEYRETATLEEKKLAMKLAYYIVTDKRNTNRYLSKFIAKENKDGLFRYADMLRGMRVIFDEIANQKDYESDDVSPAVHAEPVRHGRWIGNAPFLCTSCKNSYPYMCKFCPNCGAKMRGDSDG